MKFGVKTYDSKEFLDNFEDKSDFFEVQAIRGNDYSFLGKYNQEIVLHCEHQKFGVNIADSSLNEDNFKSVEFAKELADKFNVKKIVIHPGYWENDNCTFENVIDFMKKYCDNRFIVENMPFCKVEGKDFRFGSSVEEMKFILERTGLDFCFDINHAIEFSLAKGLDYWEVLREFEKLKPVHHHLGGERMSDKISHVSFNESDLDLKKVFSIISNDAEVTLEVGMDEKEVERDLELVRSLNNKS